MQELKLTVVTWGTVFGTLNLINGKVGRTWCMGVSFSRVPAFGWFEGKSERHHLPHWRPKSMVHAPERPTRRRKTCFRPLLRPRLRACVWRSEPQSKPDMMKVRDSPNQKQVRISALLISCHRFVYTI